MDKAVNSLKRFSPLGQYISLVSKKNRNLESTKLIGVSSDKEIIVSLYSGKNTNLTWCLLISNNQFVVRLMDIEETRKLAVGLYKRKELAVVSSQYHVFEVNNPNLSSEYLMLIFKKESTDLQLLYMCFGGVRGELSWKDFIKLPISVPPLEVQKKVVNKYETLDKTIQLKKKINEKLEDFMQCLFHLMFDNLEEFSNETFGNLFQIVRWGQTYKI
ncbi:restriction endonuclease subunit S [Mycoplasma ovis]|uniref:restriction endonuclease subunit S n=1 Tax=Mycoplasma ovis TaxID=171632 RepID=UPI0004000FB1|nr:restriction endonuclease subunit S [Mycoplasma ovis]